MKKNIIFGTFLFLSSCDFNHFKKCEWTLEPEADNIRKLNKESIEKNFIPVCARNRTTNKQNCNLKADLTYAKEVYGKKFVYNDMVIEKSGSFPRSVLEIKSFCNK